MGQNKFPKPIKKASLNNNLSHRSYASKIASPPKYILRAEDLSVGFSGKTVLNKINMDVAEYAVTAIMGPSGCGKSTFIRAINRMHDLDDKATVSGKLYLRKDDLFAASAMEVRRRVGMVFQKPNPFPSMTVAENVLAGYTLNGISLKRHEKEQLVEENLQKAALWSEMKDRLHDRGNFLSGGQQQRLCIARSLAIKVEILLLDEPTSALDPLATLKIENLIQKLKKEITILMVTHNTGQASRISDYTAFIYLGELIEYNKTKKIFTVPKDKRTERYLSGKFG